MASRSMCPEAILKDSRKCFDCPMLHARMLKTECLNRHRRRPARRTTRSGAITVFNDIANLYCQSRKCETGRKIWRQVKGKKP